MQAMGLSADPKALALDILIRDSLINDAADALHINITPGYIESRLRTSRSHSKTACSDYCPLMYLTKGGNVNPAALSRYLAHEKISNEDLTIYQRGHVS